MFVKFRLATKWREEVWVNPNNVFAVMDKCLAGVDAGGTAYRDNNSLIYSGARGYDGKNYIRVEGSAHEVLDKLNEGN